MINPKDVFPRRNLPDESEEWGRGVETRIQAVESVAVSQKTLSSSQNRTSASTLQSLARQVRRVQELYASIPKPFVATATNTGFGLSPDWNTVVSASLTVPDGATQVTVKADGSGLLVSPSTSTVVTSYSRMLINGVAGPVVPNAWYPGSGDFRSILVPSDAKTFAVVPGSSITVAVQVYADDAASYPPAPGSYAVVTLTALFTG